jgi:hypothetical protein
MSNPVVFFDVTIGGEPAGRIEMTVSGGSVDGIIVGMANLRLGG